jgi:hypothetical protein
MERKTYYLNLLSLIPQFGQQKVALYTTFPYGVPEIPEPCIGTVHIQEGRIMECSIEGRSGVSINGTKAFQILRTVVAWQVESAVDTHSMGVHAADSATSSSPPQLQPLPLDKVIPQRNMPLQPTHLDGLTAKERIVLRSVLALINGQRSVDQIKAQMKLPPETVERVLWQLRSMQIISW